MKKVWIVGYVYNDFGEYGFQIEYLSLDRKKAEEYFAKIPDKGSRSYDSTEGYKLRQYPLDIAVDSGYNGSYDPKDEE